MPHTPPPAPVRHTEDQEQKVTQVVAHSRIEHTTLHQINDHDANSTYQAVALHLADGRIVAYKVDTNDDGEHSFIPAETGLAAFLGR